MNLIAGMYALKYVQGFKNASLLTAYLWLRIGRSRRRGQGNTALALCWPKLEVDACWQDARLPIGFHNSKRSDLHSTILTMR